MLIILLYFYLNKTLNAAFLRLMEQFYTVVLIILMQEKIQYLFHHWLKRRISLKYGVYL